MPDAPPERFGLVLRQAQAERLPSVSGAVVRDGELVWTEALGLADAESGEESTPDHQYRIGSITKTFTAVSLMQLRDAGKLELDDELERHIPEAAHGQPTLRRMLAHLSGLQREPPGEIWESMKFPSPEELLAGLGEAEQVLAPGERWHYSNLAYALLGQVVARRAGMPYERYVEERILEPLGLRRTTFARAEPFALGYFVDPYSETVHAEPVLDEATGAAAVGQLWSTASDLCRWGAFLADPDPSVLAPASLEEMTALQVMADQSWTLGWGLGLMLHRRGERLFVGHDGGMPGFLAGLVVNREAKIGAAVLTASTSGKDPTEVALELAEQAIELLPTPPEPWRPGEAPPPELAGALGRWWSEGSEFVFSWHQGRLEARRADDPTHKQPAVFAPDGEDRFRSVSGREHGELLRIVRDELGEPVRLYWATYPFLRAPGPFAGG